MKIPTRLATAVFSRVFSTSKETTKELGPQITAAVQSISQIGGKRVKEFLAALPIFVLFVRELLRHRDEVQAQKQFAIIGAAAALSTLGMVALGSLLGSLPVQLLLVVTHPFIGVPLLFSGGLVLSVVMVAIVWLIIYCLNFVLADDPIYQRIHEEFIPVSTKAVLADIQAEIETGGADLEALRRVVEERLKANSPEVDVVKLEGELQRLEKRLRALVLARLSKA